MKINKRMILFTVILVALATYCKFLFGPDLEWSGFSPVIAIALFSGFIMKEKDSSFLLPLLALFVSDVIIHILYIQDLFPYAGFYEGQWKNYLILMLTALVGWMLKGRSHASLLAGALAGPTVFFLLSNFGVWLSVGEVVYPGSFSGLMQSYVAGLPFYKNALLGTLVFLPCILLAYNFLTRKKAALIIA